MKFSITLLLAIAPTLLLISSSMASGLSEVSNTVSASLSAPIIEQPQQINVAPLHDLPPIQNTVPQFINNPVINDVQATQKSIAPAALISGQIIAPAAQNTAGDTTATQNSIAPAALISGQVNAPVIQNSIAGDTAATQKSIAPAALITEQIIAPAAQNIAGSNAVSTIPVASVGGKTPGSADSNDPLYVAVPNPFHRILNQPIKDVYNANRYIDIDTKLHAEGYFSISPLQSSCYRDGRLLPSCYTTAARFVSPDTFKNLNSPFKTSNQPSNGKENVDSNVRFTGIRNPMEMINQAVIDTKNVGNQFLNTIGYTGTQQPVAAPLTGAPAAVSQQQSIFGSLKGRGSNMFNGFMGTTQQGNPAQLTNQPPPLPPLPNQQIANQQQLIPPAIVSHNTIVAGEHGGSFTPPYNAA